MDLHEKIVNDNVEDLNLRSKDNKIYNYRNIIYKFLIAITIFVVIEIIIVYLYKYFLDLALLKKIVRCNDLITNAIKYVNPELQGQMLECVKNPGFQQVLKTELAFYSDISIIRQKYAFHFNYIKNLLTYLSLIIYLSLYYLYLKHDTRKL